MKKGIYLNDSIHGLIPLSEYEKRIISSIGFNRLHDVYQNSPQIEPNVLSIQ